MLTRDSFLLYELCVLSGVCRGFLVWLCSLHTSNIDAQSFFNCPCLTPQNWAPTQRGSRQNTPLLRQSPDNNSSGVGSSITELHSHTTSIMAKSSTSKKVSQPSSSTTSPPHRVHVHHNHTKSVHSALRFLLLTFFVALLGATRGVGFPSHTFESSFPYTVCQLLADEHSECSVPFTDNVLSFRGVAVFLSLFTSLFMVKFLFTKKNSTIHALLGIVQVFAILAALVVSFGEFAQIYFGDDCKYQALKWGHELTMALFYINSTHLHTLFGDILYLTLIPCL